MNPPSEHSGTGPRPSPTTPAKPVNAPASHGAVERGETASIGTTTRRRWLFAGVAGAAAATGFGLAWRNGHVGQGAASPEQALWDLRFNTPQGGELAMRSLMGKPLLLNFWATWCAPCIEEMPLLDRFYAENKANGWQVLGLAVDQAGPVTRFLERMPMQFPIALAGFSGIDLSRKLGNTTGGLPFSVLLDGSARVRHRKIGQLSAQDLQQWQTLR